MNFKLRLGIVMAAVLLAGNAMAQDLETEQAELGYIIGMDIGNSLRNEGTDIDLDTALELVRRLNVPGRVSDEDIEQLRALEEAEALAPREVACLSIARGNLTPA